MHTLKSATIDVVTLEPGSPDVLQSMSASVTPTSASSTDDRRSVNTNSACVRLLPLEEDKRDRPGMLPSCQAACLVAPRAATPAASEAQPPSADMTLSKAASKLSAKGWSAEALAELFELPLGEVDKLLSKSSGCPRAVTTVEGPLAGG